MTFWYGAFWATLGGLAVLVSVSLSAADRRVLLRKKRVFRGRTYAVALPRKVTKNTKIILGLDGFAGSGKRFAYYTALHNVDPTAIVIYPDPVAPAKKGIRSGWNAGFCCGSGWVQKVDDVAFLKQLIKHVADKCNAKEAKVFATGFSNGAFMVQRLAIDAPGLLSAVAVVAGTIGTEEKHLVPHAAIPIMLVHGLEDKIVPYNGNVGTSDGSFTWLSFERTKRAWKQANKDSAEVLVRTFSDGGHVWRGWRTVAFWRRKPQLSREVAAFFERYA